MVTVNQDFLAALFTDFKLEFEDWFLAATNANDYTRVCTVMKSNTLTESLNWLGTVPKMRLWVDERVHQSIAPAFTYSLTNQHYEATVDVDRDTIEDDTYGLIRPRVSQLGMEAGRYPWELAMTALTSNGTCYDGQAFFSASHSEESSGTQSNLYTGSGTTVTQILTDYAAAIAQMRRLKDNKGRPMNLGNRGGLTVLAPPEMEQQLNQIANGEFIVVSTGSGVFGQESNYLKGAFNVIIDPYLSDTNDWYLLDLSQPVKPLIYLDRKAPEFVAQDDPRDFSVFNKRLFSYGVDFRGTVGYGPWQFGLKVTNT